MLDKWVFVLAAVLIALAEIQYAIVLRKQYTLFKTRSVYQPLKRLLFAVVIAMMLGALPLFFVYINIVWLQWNNLYIVYAAVICNALAKNMAGLALNLVYNFRAKGDEDLLA